MIVHRDARNNLTLGQAGNLNGIPVEFRPSHIPEEEIINVMESAIGQKKYIVIARSEPSLQDMAAAISKFIAKNDALKRKRNAPS